MPVESEELHAAFEVAFGRKAEIVASAPGRVNLLGEHTDYNGGLVLPTPVPLSTTVALARRDDRDVVVRSHAMAAVASYGLGSERTRRSWVDHVQGVTGALQAHGHAIEGFDVLIMTDLPLGSGLSSSAALAVSLLRALRVAFELTLDDLELVRLAQWGENSVVDAPVGILDPLACHLGDHGSALFIDTRSLEHERLPLPESADVLVIDSRVKHHHASGGYRRRRAECEIAAQGLGLRLLRDLTEDLNPALALLPPPLPRRVRHVLTENARVLEAVHALRAGDAVRLGALFNASHASMRDDYEVSVPEVDRIVAAAIAMPEVLGARLTGGGFGGAVVCLVRRGAGPVVARELSAYGVPLVTPPGFS